MQPEQACVYLGHMLDVGSGSCRRMGLEQRGAYQLKTVNLRPSFYVLRDVPVLAPREDEDWCVGPLVTKERQYIGVFERGPFYHLV